VRVLQFLATKQDSDNHQKQQQENPMNPLDQKIVAAANAESRGDVVTSLAINEEISTMSIDQQNKKVGSQFSHHDNNAAADAYATNKSSARARKVSVQSPNKVEVENDREMSNHHAVDASIPSTILVASIVVVENKAPSSSSIHSSATSNVLHSSAPAAAFNILQKLSNACMNLKDYDSALKDQVHSLDAIERSHTSTNPRIVTILNNMGHIHFTKGDMQNSIMCYKQCLNAQKSFPEDKRDLLAEAGTASMIGCIYRRIGRLNAAIDWHETAINLRTKVLGEDHISLSSDLIAIGHIHYSQRKLDFSLAAFSECIEVLNGSVPADSISAADPGLLTSILFKMGGICIELEDRLSAINCYEDAVNVARAAAVGSSSTSSTGTPDCSEKTCEVLIIRSLYKLARIHQEEGNISKAIDCAEEAIQFGLLDAPTVLVVPARNESMARILSFMLRLYQDKGDDAKVQLCCRRLSEVVLDDTGRPTKRTKLFGARAA